MVEPSKVKFTAVAQEDITNIYGHIFPDDPSAAVRFIDMIDDALARLRRFPLLGKVPDDPRLMAYGYRVLIVKKYLLFYVYQEEVIIVMRIVHSSQSLDGLFDRED